MPPYLAALLTQIDADVAFFDATVFETLDEGIILSSLQVVYIRVPVTQFGKYQSQFKTHPSPAE